MGNEPQKFELCESQEISDVEIDAELSLQRTHSSPAINTQSLGANSSLKSYVIDSYIPLKFQGGQDLGESRISDTCEKFSESQKSCDLQLIIEEESSKGMFLSLLCSYISSNLFLPLPKVTNHDNLSQIHHSLIFLMVNLIKIPSQPTYSPISLQPVL